MSLATNDRTIRELVARIDEVSNAQEAAATLSKNLARRETELRAELLDHMERTDVRNALVGDISVIIRSIRSIDITDEDALRQATVDAGVEDAYMVFDRNRAKIAAYDREWPGIEVTRKSQLVVSKAVKS